MAQLHVLMGADTIRARPVIRTIGLADLKDALTRGLADFSAIPTHAVFLCLIYPIVGLVLARAILGYALLPLLFPLAAGFALVGPFAAIGFYELSRRREQGLDISWEDALDVLHSPSRDAIAALGFLLLVIFAIWIAITPNPPPAPQISTKSPACTCARDTSIRHTVTSTSGIEAASSQVRFLGLAITLTAGTLQYSPCAPSSGPV